MNGNISANLYQVYNFILSTGKTPTELIFQNNKSNLLFSITLIPRNDVLDTIYQIKYNIYPSRSSVCSRDFSCFDVVFL